MTFSQATFATVITLINHLFTIEDAVYRITARNHVSWFEYDGYDASAIITAILEVFRRVKPEEAFDDLIDMVVIGLTRGNIRLDQLAKTSAQGAARIKELQERYKIYLRPNARKRDSLGKDTLTFSRVISVFPYVASQILASGAVVSADFHCKFGSNELPLAMRHSGFGSLIPVGSYWSRIVFHAYVAYMITFGEKINPSNKSTLMEKYVAQRQFTEAAWANTNVYNNDNRIQAFSNLKLNTAALGAIYLKIANDLLGKLGKELFDVTKANSLIVDNLITYAEET